LALIGAAGNADANGPASASTNLVSSSANPSPTGSNLTLTATLTAVVEGSGTPTGTVQFLADGAALGAPAAMSGGIASVTTSSLSHGIHTITAQYAGDTNFLGSTNSLVQIIDTAPVAASDTLQRYALCGAKVSTTELLASDSDPEKYALTLISAGTNSTAGGAVTVSAGWVYYTPASGFTNADSFPYTISDGTLLATGLVSVIVPANLAASQNLSSIDALTNGSSRVRLSGVPGRTYTIQYTTNLAAPSWQTLGSATAAANGCLNYTNGSSSDLAQSYRSTYP